MSDTNLEERVYRTVDKSGWGDGPWTEEPDKVVWIDPATGLDCMVKRGPAGAWCGYVGVGPDHLLHGKGYSECVNPKCTDDECWDYSHSIDVSVHGGLTYADSCNGSEESGICHIPAPGRPHDVWWLGFDCNHSGDFAPAYSRQFTPFEHEMFEHEMYRTVSYAKDQVIQLAEQVAKYA